MFKACLYRTRQLWLVSALAALTLPAHADEKSFALPGGPAVLGDVSAEVGLRFTGMRFSPADNAWLVDVALTNRSLKLIPTPLVLWVESYAGTTGPLEPDGTEGDNPAHAFYDYTAQTPDGQLWPGDKTQLRTLKLGFSAGAPTISGRVYAKLSALPPGLTQVRTLNEAGQPLPGVQVSETSPLGNTSTTSDPHFGLATLGRTNGPHAWLFSLADHLPVWRQANLQPGEVSLLHSPRLTRQANGVTIPLAGGSVIASNVQLTVPPGAFAGDSLVRVTPLTPQTLPALLPLGWSPLQGFQLDAPADPLVPLSATIDFWGPAFGSETAALVWWNSNVLAWEAVQAIAGPATNANVNLPKRGAFAVVVPDTGSWTPPTAAVGLPLAAANFPLPGYAGLSATGSVTPSISLASHDPDRVTGQARVLITSGAEALPSGLSLFSQLRERYSLFDGSPRRTPPYENFLAAYQRPGDTFSNTLHAGFPMRPLLLLGAESLMQATVEADLLPPGDYGLRVLGPAGGLASVASVSLRASSGAFARREAFYLRPLTTEDLALLSASNAPVIAGFDLGLAGIGVGHSLELQIAGLPTNGLFVLARVIVQEGWFGLEPVQRLASDAAGILTSLEPGSGERLPGLTGAGQFALVRVDSPQGLITGVARDAGGSPAPGLPVRVEVQPWLTLSGTGGVYRLIAPAGTALVIANDPRTGDSGQTTVNIVAPNVPVNANPDVLASGPRVASLTPTNGAVNVARVTPVVVQFSEPINPATLGTNGVELLGTNGQPVAASLTLNLAHTVATLLPVTQLAANTLHTLRLSSNITDHTGLRLDGPSHFTFTTENDALDRVAAKLTSYEPVNGQAVMVGSPGTADPESPVILVNETTGQTATILSKPDGSFSNSIPADVDDFLSAVLVNLNGTENRIPVSRQVFRDGSVGLFKGGGIVEAQSDGGPVQVLIEPGAIPNKTRVWLQRLNLSSVMATLQNTTPSNAVVLGGFVMAQSGDPLAAAAEVEFPVDPNTFGLPAGSDPTNASFALTVPVKWGEEVVYHVIDTMGYEGGKLVTHSPPYMGLLLDAIKDFYKGQLFEAITGLSGGFVNLFPDQMNGFGFPDLDGALVRSMFVPIMVAQGPTTTVAGKVIVQKVDAAGNTIAGTDKPLPGALVRILDASALMQAGRLSPGTLFTLSREDGSYAFPVTADPFQADTILAVATHARYPRMIAASAASIGSLYDRFNRANILTLNLPFNLPPEDPFSVVDTSEPILTISYTPRDPAPGRTIDDGAFITVSGRDEVAISEVSLAKVATTNLDPAQTEDTATLVEIGGATTTGTTLVRRYYLSTDHRAVVRLRALAVDGSGHTTQVETDIVIAGNRSFPPPTSDAPGPKVLSCWPMTSSTGVTPGAPLVLRFSAPLQIDAASNITSWFQVTQARINFARLSPDATEVTVCFDARPGVVVSGTVETSLLGANNRAFDQDPGTAGDQTFSFSFTMAEATVTPLPDLELGAGVITAGKYALALDSLGDQEGSLNVYDLTAATPTRKTVFGLPGYPRDLCLIPNYSYRLRESDDCVTADLLAVVGGRISTRGFQYLWLIDVTDPLNPVRVASGVIAVSSVAVTRVRWSAPYLAYLENGSDLSSVGIVHLQKFIVGMNATTTELDAFSTEGREGTDLNADGDYCDAGEVLPLPAKLLTEFFGKEFSLAIETTQAIRDFDLDSRTALAGVTLGPGLAYPGAPPTVPAVPPAYRTIFSGLGEVDPVLAPLFFDATTELKRVFIAADTPIEIGASLDTRDLAVLSLRRLDTGRHALAAVDITDPEAPLLLHEVDVSAYGVPQNIQRRSDGLLALATSTDVLLLDAARIATPSNSVSGFPALVGVLEGLGSGFRFAAPETGVGVVAGGGRSQVVRTAPKISFVTFPAQTPVLAASLAGLSRSHLVEMLAGAALPGLLPRTTLFHTPNPGDPPVLQSPPNPHTHFYVRVDALVEDQPELELILQGLDEDGNPLPAGSSGRPPGTLAARTTLSTLSLPTSAGTPAFQRSLVAHRLSDLPGDPLFTVYLAGPIVITDETFTVDQMEAITAELDRVILQGGRSVWAGLDPTNDTTDFSTSVLSRFGGGGLVPGSAANATIGGSD